MPAPMPAQPGAPAPASAPAQDPQGDPNGPDGGGGIKELIGGAHDDLMKIGQVLEKANIPPALLQKYAQVIQAFQSVIQEALSGGGGDQGPQPDQNLSPEAGAQDVKPVL